MPGDFISSTPSRQGVMKGFHDTLSGRINSLLLTKRLAMSRNRILTVFILFAIAMAFLEGAVVSYLRALYYPEGFAFPLKMMPPSIALTELLREAATLIMLVTVALLAGKTRMERLAFFLLGFGVWDIFYYVFLKVILGWPASLVTWDILFLLPTPWVGPVMAPVINSLTMIVLAFYIIHFTHQGRKATFSGYEWILLIVGSMVILAAFTEEYIRFMSGAFRFTDFFSSSRQTAIMRYTSTFVPRHFKWYLFLGGVIVQLAAVVLYIAGGMKHRPAVSRD